MRVLVAGADRVDAGKTTVSVGLLAHLRERGRPAVGAKPRAGHDYWFDHDDAVAALAGGRLYGDDAARLAAAGADAAPPEARNPIHRLWRPTPGRTGMLGESDRTFLVDRLRAPGTASTNGSRAGTAPDTAGDTFVVNGAAADAGLLPAPVREALPVESARRVADVASLNDLTAERYLPALSALADRLADRETVVVESYADVADPFAGGLGYDAVAVATPSELRVYDGDRYADARQVGRHSDGRGRLEARVPAVVDGLDPVAEVSLPPLTATARDDPTEVAAAYRPGYEAVVAAAE